jgi:type I restriction enzyme R subunit
MSNFDFLQHEFTTLKANSVKSEMYAMEDPGVSALYARKSLENSIKFIYKVDETLGKKLMKNLDLAGMLQHPKFRDILPFELNDEIKFVRQLGNTFAHSNQEISTSKSMYANKCLYKLQRWMIEVYSNYVVENEYDVTKLIRETSKETQEEIEKQSQEEERLAEENAKLQAQIEALTSQIPNKKQHLVKVEGLSEKETRKQLIDLELRQAGYNVDGFKHGVDIEYKVTFDDGTLGYVDYVIWSYDNKPLAVIEAKKSSVDVSVGKHQAKRYTEALKKEFNCDVLTFVTNGRVIEYSNGVYPFREIHSIFPLKEMQRALKKKNALELHKPSTYSVNDTITDRGYQKRVINSVLRHYEEHQTRALLVMATGTGKTRVSASISDILIRAKWANKILFLADRKELVKQAFKNFNSYLDETCVNLGAEKELENRLHFGTYETVHNLIGKGLYNSAFFDLIIVDEAHRTIYKKYRGIFEYFDSFVLGLTATPADEVHRNTYDFFQTGDEPTDSYGFNRAVNDGNLVPFKAFEIDLGIVKRGIKYDDLDADEQEEYEDKFDVEEEEEISSSEINQRVLNKETNEKVLKHLQQYGIKIDEGNRIGKTIVFAKNKKHAEYLKSIFDLLYPKRSAEAEIIHSEIAHVESLLERFKNPNKLPQIAISVDMLDTGIDVPELVNLVFFKPVKSKIKFWQMIGRGTRLCPNLFGEGMDKDHFKIFDFCANFEFFNVNTEGTVATATKSLKERLFLKRVGLLKSMEKGEVQAKIEARVKAQLNALDSSDYNLKKHRHTIEKLQGDSLGYIDDALLQELKSIAEYVDDAHHVEEQRYEMLSLNLQEAMVKGKNQEPFSNEIKERCRVLKSKATSVKAIKKHEDAIDAVLEGSNPLSTIEEVEALSSSISHLANLSLAKRVKPVTTNFKDVVEEVRDVESDYLIKEASIETALQKALNEYIDQLSLIKEIRDKELINDNDINELKHQIFEYEKLLEERLFEQKDFAEVMQEIMNASKKEIANKIFDNYIEAGAYNHKQIELMNRVKNILFGKKYATLEDSIDGVREVLLSEHHAIANAYNRLNETEQEVVLELIGLLSVVDGQLSY